MKKEEQKARLEWHRFWINRGYIINETLPDEKGIVNGTIRMKEQRTIIEKIRDRWF